MLTLSSKHNANPVGYWESSTCSARLAYNWRSKYMVRETGDYSNRMHDDHGSRDGPPTDKLRLSLERSTC